MNGYTDIICGTTSLDYYVSKETKDILRVDITMSFAGTAADKTNITGEISGSMIVTGTTDENIVRPEPEKVEVDTAETAYTAGEIFSDNNSYQNQYFGIQVMGRELFYFDRDKTEELKITYQESGSKYQEEAYGNGDGIILNISSIPSKGASTEDVIQTILPTAPLKMLKLEKTLRLQIKIMQRPQLLLMQPRQKPMQQVWMEEYC